MLDHRLNYICVHALSLSLSHLNYALRAFLLNFATCTQVLDPANPGATLTFERTGPVPDVPFSSQETSCVIHATVRSVRAWGFARDGSAAPPPVSPIDCSGAGACGTPIKALLVPFGTTHLRMTEMPFTAA